MKHIFIINTCAGSKSREEEIKKAVSGKDDCLIYLPENVADSHRFVRQKCEEYGGEELRFYACGGDGTANAVATGILGFPNASIGIYPSGSGNDFIKYYRETSGLQEADFLDIDRMMNGKTVPADVMRVEVKGGPKDGTYYSMNVANFGFDANVALTMEKVRRVPVIGGKRAYFTGVFWSIFTARWNRVDINVDGEPFHRGAMLLSTLSNGQYVGGAFRCGPLSRNDDGLIEVSLFRTISLARFLSLLGPYQKGEHFQVKGIEKVCKYKRGKEVEISHDKPFYLCLDGEMEKGTSFHITQMEHAIRIILPQK